MDLVRREKRRQEKKLNKSRVREPDTEEEYIEAGVCRAISVTTDCSAYYPVQFLEQLKKSSLFPTKLNGGVSKRTLNWWSFASIISMGI